MTPRYDHAGIALYQGDCRQAVASLPDQSVQCVVTSPPYFGLRDYGTAQWDGGDPGCDHILPSRIDTAKTVRASTLEGGKGAVGHLKEPSYRNVCGRCGATRVDSQIGLEQTPAAYVAEMVAVFREVRRILRDDGTLWLNLGDSYAGSWGNYSGQNRGKGDSQRPITVGSMPTKAWDGREQERPAASRKMAGIKEKDLIGIPWRVAFALQEDGWYLRSDIVWHKPNPMPESVTDRPTRSHEYIFLLTKSARYYYDADAIREPSVYPEDTRGARVSPAHKRMPTEMVNGIRGGERRYPLRNKRDIWTVATAPYAEAHFATFPPKLIEPCILAGAPAGGVVLDPFAGAGTTLLVAKNLGRCAIGIELNADYCDLVEERLRQDVLPLAVTA